MFILLYIIIYPLYWLLLLHLLKPQMQCTFLWSKVHVYKKLAKAYNDTESVFHTPIPFGIWNVIIWTPTLWNKVEWWMNEWMNEWIEWWNDERTILNVSFSISGERSPTNMWWCSEVSFFCVTAWAGPPHKHIHHYLSDSFKYLGWNFLINQSWKLL